MTPTEGSWRRFTARARCDRPDEVWHLWTTPSTWGEWDRGVRSAELTGPFATGATGTLTDLNGRRSRFTVDEVDAGRSTRWHVVLPGGRMELTRLLDDGHVEHRVRFHGPLAPVSAATLGRRFKPLLGPTVDALLTTAARDA